MPAVSSNGNMLEEFSRRNGFTLNYQNTTTIAQEEEEEEQQQQQQRQQQQQIIPNGHGNRAKLDLTKLLTPQDLIRTTPNF